MEKDTYESGRRRIEYKTSLLMGLIVIVISSLSVAWALVLSKSGVADLLGSPFVPEESPQGVLINSLIILFLVLLGTGLLLVLIRFRKIHTIPAVMAFAVAFSFWGIAEIYFYSLANLAPLERYSDYLLQYADLLSVSVAVLAAVLIIKPVSVKLLDILLIIYGTMAGSLLAVTLPGWTPFAVAVILAVYDVYSVFYGPLKRILENTVGEGQSRESKLKSPLRGAVIVIDNIALGMGDVLMYSMLSSSYYLFPFNSAARWVLTTIAIALGLYFTLKMLTRKKYMPALPIPVFLSLAVYVICLLIGF
ncbi:MAG: hypothetical protein JHC26_07065 [Thermofilum sp.]|uniref:hypothetical protein n=1 Tax=Thermofilum sp. TaxID=1961369 RepID=UPI00258EB4D5|nr:hypothetical protein [Thermofilum sp.]MCI4408836.1 hypothetical protein [Thermofilum sp.]